MLFYSSVSSKSSSINHSWIVIDFAWNHWTIMMIQRIIIPRPIRTLSSNTAKKAFVVRNIQKIIAIIQTNRSIHRFLIEAFFAWKLSTVIKIPLMIATNPARITASDIMKFQNSGKRSKNIQNRISRTEIIPRIVLLAYWFSVREKIIPIIPERMISQLSTIIINLNESSGLKNRNPPKRMKNNPLIQNNDFTFNMGYQ